MRRPYALILLLGIGLASFRHVASFRMPRPTSASCVQRTATCSRPRKQTHLYSSSNRKRQPGDFSTEVRLRVEADSPFLKVRQAGLSVLLAGASISLILSLTRIAAALSGINTDLLQESATNAAIDLLGIAGLGLLLKRDNDAQLSKLKRVSRGAELAALTVRLPDTAGKPVVTDERAEDATTSTTKTSPSSSSVVSLSALRSGRGIEKRVVIAVAGSDRMKQILEKALRLEESLFANDLLLVPVVTPGFQAPSTADLPAEMDTPLTDVRSIALPLGQDWRLVLEDETADATEQGVDVEGEGFCLVLKKNGRIGTRTKGIALARMVGEVVDRRDAGLDVINI